jgi:hypothetical protein
VRFLPRRACILSACPSHAVGGGGGGRGVLTRCCNIQLLEEDSQSIVIAGVRNPETAEQLTDIVARHPGRVRVIKLDVSDVDSIKVEPTQINNAIECQSI